MQHTDGRFGYWGIDLTTVMSVSTNTTGIREQFSVFGLTQFLFDRWVLPTFYRFFFALPSLLLRSKAGKTTSDSAKPV